MGAQIIVILMYMAVIAEVKNNPNIIFMKSKKHINNFIIELFF